MAPAVVRRRSTLSCVKRVKATFPSPASRHTEALSRWTWSASSKASQTLTSGKLNELINLFIGEVEFPFSGGHDGRIEFEPPPGARLAGFGLLHRLLNAGQDQLAGGTALAHRGLAQSPMEIARDID